VARQKTKPRALVIGHLCPLFEDAATRFISIAPMAKPQIPLHRLCDAPAGGNFHCFQSLSAAVQHHCIHHVGNHAAVIGNDSHPLADRESG